MNKTHQCKWCRESSTQMMIELSKRQSRHGTKRSCNKNNEESEGVYIKCGKSHGEEEVHGIWVEEKLSFSAFAFVRRVQCRYVRGFLQNSSSCRRSWFYRPSCHLISQSEGFPAIWQSCSNEMGSDDGTEGEEVPFAVQPAKQKF